MGNDRKKPRNQRILGGYQRQGKRFLSPMKQLSNLREFSYLNDLLPELLWVGLIYDRVGYQKGVRILEAAVGALKDEPKSDIPLNYALQTSYLAVDSDGRDSVLRAWKEHDMLDDVRTAVAPLVLLYEGCALTFVGPPADLLPEGVLISRVSDAVEKYADKHDTPGTMLHAAIMLSDLASGRLKFTRNVQVPDLNAIVDAPGSDEAERAGSFVRASAAAHAGFLDTDTAWARHFWNHGARLTPCRLPEG